MTIYGHLMFGTTRKKKKALGVSGGRRKVRFGTSHRSMTDLHSPPKGAKSAEQKKKQQK